MLRSAVSMVLLVWAIHAIILRSGLPFGQIGYSTLLQPQASGVPQLVHAGACGIGAFLGGLWRSLTKSHRLFFYCRADYLCHLTQTPAGRLFGYYLRAELAGSFFLIAGGRITCTSPGKFHPDGRHAYMGSVQF